MIDFQEQQRRKAEFKESLTNRLHEKMWSIYDPEFEKKIAEETNPGRKMVLMLTPHVNTMSVARDMMVYTGINHYLLFEDYSLQPDPGAERFTAEEIYDIFKTLDKSAVGVILRKMNCSHDDFEALMSAWSVGNKNAFIHSFQSLSYDTTGLSKICSQVIMAQQAGGIIMADFDAYKEYVALNAIKQQDEDNMLTRLVKRLTKVFTSGYEDTSVTILGFVNEEPLFDFEKDILLAIVNAPESIDLQQKENKNLTEPQTTIAPIFELQYQYEIPSDIFDDNKTVLDDTLFVHNLVDGVTGADDAVARFQLLFQFILKWGKIVDKAEQDAMLTLLTGYYIRGAASKARWCCDDYLPRILYHIIKHISDSRQKYQPLLYVDFYYTNESLRQSVNGDLDIIRGSNPSKSVDERIPPEIRRALWNCYPKLFPKPKSKV